MKPYKSVRVFKSPLLERLTHVHPLTPLILWGPVSMWFIWRAFAVHQLSPITVACLGFIGFMTWTLAEYVLHRFLFHFEIDSPLGQRAHFLMHGLHHEDPIDPTRLVMPPSLSIILCIILYNIFQWALGPTWVDPFFGFFIIGYLCYDYIHFYVHHFRPQTRIGRYLKNSHMQHHYVSANSRWGVSSPFWDYVFGTLEESKKKEQTA